MCATDQVLPCSLIRSTSWVSTVSSKISERLLWDSRNTVYDIQALMKELCCILILRCLKSVALFSFPVFPLPQRSHRSQTALPNLLYEHNLSFLMGFSSSFPMSSVSTSSFDDKHLTFDITELYMQ